MAMKHFFLEVPFRGKEGIPLCGERRFTISHDHEVALWSAVASFFASLLAIGVFDITDAAGIFALVGAIIVSFVTAGSVYAKQRLDDAKKEEGS